MVVGAAPTNGSLSGSRFRRARLRQDDGFRSSTETIWHDTDRVMPGRDDAASRKRGIELSGFPLTGGRLNSMNNTIMVKSRAQIESPRELYVLGMLSRGKTYGHELMRTVQVSRADLWVALSEKHIYYILQKLAKQRLVTETVERHGKRPPRKVYHLTDSGRAALSELLCARALQEEFAPTPFDAVIGVLAYSSILDR